VYYSHHINYFLVNKRDVVNAVKTLNYSIGRSLKPYLYIRVVEPAVEVSRSLLLPCRTPRRRGGVVL
jgi:hypothetical protein